MVRSRKRLAEEGLGVSEIIAREHFLVTRGRPHMFSHYPAREREGA